MYRSNPQFVRVQRVSGSDNYATTDNPRILYRYEEPSNRQFAVAQNRRERVFSDIDERYESTSPSYRGASARCNSEECEECTCGNSNSTRYPINTFAYQPTCSGNSCQLNTCQSGCCGDSCGLPYNQDRPRIFYR